MDVGDEGCAHAVERLPPTVNLVSEAHADLTIDDLAREAGMTARNVRAYRERGLLPEPELRGRKGFYGPEHLTRLHLIRELMERGFSLESIRHLIERAPAESLGDALEFTHALITAPADAEQPEVVTAQVFLDRWGDQLTPELAQRAEELGFVRRVGRDEWEVPSPRLARASQALSELGVPLRDALEIGAVLHEHSAAVARAYIDLFKKNVWQPFEEAGEPAEDWARVRESLDRLRPLAGESLLAAFQLMMSQAVERELESMAGADEPTA
jgi:DNA-binding transcriptional MerR regulator